MTEAEWLACDDSRAVFAALPPGVSGRKLLLFCVRCCFLSAGEPDPDTAGCVYAELWRRVERFAEGEAGEPELRDAWDRLARGDDDDDRVWPLRPYAAALRWAEWDDSDEIGDAEVTPVLREIFGNPFRPVTFSPSWRTSTAVTLASRMYAARDFSATPILADALQDAGCDCPDVLDHCRGPGPHVRGCWVVDLVLGKE